MADVVTEPISQHEGAQTLDGVVDRLEALWHGLCEFSNGMEVATRHALDDLELRPEDELHLGGLAALRSELVTCASTPDLPGDIRYFIEELDRRLSTFEGRAEIARLAAS